MRRAKHDEGIIPTTIGVAQKHASATVFASRRAPNPRGLLDARTDRSAWEVFKANDLMICVVKRETPSSFMILERALECCRKSVHVGRRALSLASLLPERETISSEKRAPPRPRHCELLITDALDSSNTERSQAQQRRRDWYAFLPQGIDRKRDRTLVIAAENCCCAHISPQPLPCSCRAHAHFFDRVSRCAPCRDAHALRLEPSDACE